MVKKSYEMPEVEVIYLAVEAGFAASGGDPSGDSSGADSGWTDKE